MVAENSLGIIWDIFAFLSEARLGRHARLKFQRVWATVELITHSSMSKFESPGETDACSGEVE